MSANCLQSDEIWKALADPTRRGVLDLLSAGAMTTGSIAQAFEPLSRTGVMKHLDVLEGAGLLVVRREGRVRWNHLNPMPIQRIYERWVSLHLQGTASALSRLKNHLERGP